mgnify:CR=1 FL=1
MKIKTTDLVKLKDYVNETFLVEQVSALYGCPQGFGHNPFTNQCYPIPSKYSAVPSLAIPKVVKTTSAMSGEDPVDDPALDPRSETDRKKFAVGLGNALLNPLEAAELCWKNYPISYVAGLLFGGLSGQAGILRGSYMVGKAGLRGIKALGVTGGLLGLAGVALGAYFMNNPGKINVDKVVDAGDWTTKTYTAISNFLNSEWTDITAQGQVCMAYGFVSVYALSKLGKFGMYMGKGKIKNIIDRSSFVKDTGFAIGKKTKDFFTANNKKSHANLWIYFKEYNLLPQGSKSINLDGMTLKIEGSGKLRAPVRQVSPEVKETFKEFIVNDQFVLDLDKAAAEFADSSSKIINDTAEVYWKQAKQEVKGSKISRDLNRLSKIIGRGGTPDFAKMRSLYFKESTRILKEITDSSRTQLLELYNSGLRLNKLRPRTVTLSLMNDSRKQVARGSDVSSVLSQEKFKNLSRREMTQLEEYLSVYKTHATNELELVQKFSAAKSLMDKEMNLSLMLGQNPQLKKWYSTPEARIYRKDIEESKTFLRDSLIKLREIRESTRLFDILELFVFTSMVAGVVYTGKVILPEMQKEVSLPYIYEVSNMFFDKVVTEEYFKNLKKSPRSYKINLEKLFGDFNRFYVENTDREKDYLRSFEVVEQFCRKSANSPDVQAHLSGKGGAITRQGMKDNFQSFLVGQFKQKLENVVKVDPKDPIIKKDLNEVTIMNKKDILNIIKEVLTENSGMGYSKYPYDMDNNDEEPTEDYIEEWKSFSLSLVRDESRSLAIKVAKILVQDLELFEDVLDLAGQNKSLGLEILRKLKQAEDKNIS